MLDDTLLIIYWILLPCTAPPSCRRTCYEYRKRLENASGIASLDIITDAIKNECFLPFLASG